LQHILLISNQKIKHKGVIVTQKKMINCCKARASLDEFKGALKHQFSYLTVKVKIEPLEYILIIH
jgi:hypothetical protein